MAILTADQLTPIRHFSAVAFGVVNYTKSTINAALQAIEDTMVERLIAAGDVGLTIPQVLNAAINAATSPFVFTAVQKRILFALWAELKFQRDK